MSNENNNNYVYEEIWGDIVMKDDGDDGYVQIPHLLQKNRTKLGLSSTEYMVLIDYIAEWHYTETTNPYPKLMEYSGLGERSLQRIIESMENKGLLKREIISKPGVGKPGVWFNLSPLLNKLRTLGEESCTTNTKNINTKNINKEKETTKEKESRLQKGVTNNV